MKDTIWIKKGRFTPLAVVLMFAFPLVTALICLCFGRMNVPVGEVLTALRTALTGESTSNVQNYSIVINLRLPRILTAIIVGAGLSCAGNTYQSFLLGRSAHLGTFQQPGKEEIEMAEAMMERVGITRLANKDCNRMSGGELQMVLIARALINEPKLIILDEPETGLDFHNQILVLNLVERLAHESGISAIMNTHYPTNAMSVADEALMLNRKGEFFYGPAAEILNEENISYSFDVQVLVDELHYQGRSVRSIVPVGLREETAV